MNNYVWVAYARKPPKLPVAVAETAGDLSKITGKSIGTICSSWARYQKGVTKTSLYHRVFVGEEEE